MPETGPDVGSRYFHPDNLKRPGRPAQSRFVRATELSGCIATAAGQGAGSPK